MKISEATLRAYRENSSCIDNELSRIAAIVKGRKYDYIKLFTDRTDKYDSFTHSVPAYNDEKLTALIEDMLAVWEESLSLEKDPQMIPDYVKERRELYKNYLYCIMRVSYCTRRTGCADSATDFEDLLASAKEIVMDWCITKDGSNEEIHGLDANKAFKHYQLLNGCPLTPAKQILIFKSEDFKEEAVSSEKAVPSEDIPSEEAVSSEAEEDVDDYDIPEEDSDYEPMTWEERKEEEILLYGADVVEALEEAYLSDLYEQEQMESEKCEAEYMGRESYLLACESFAQLFRCAHPLIIRNFYQDMEDIVDMYLLYLNLTVLSDSNKCSNLYASLHNGAYRQAAMYNRGIYWNK